MNSRKKTKAEIKLLSEQLKNQQHQLEKHKHYLKQVISEGNVILGLFLGGAFLALKFRKSGRFLKILIKTLVISAPGLMLRNRVNANRISLILIQKLVISGFAFLTNKSNKMVNKQKDTGLVKQ